MWCVLEGSSRLLRSGLVRLSDVEIGAVFWHGSGCFDVLSVYYINSGVVQYKIAFTYNQRSEASASLLL
jgi:hypothetical protein